MKILFANNYAYLRGGSERVLFDEMKLVKAEGISLCMFSRQHPRNEICNTESFFPPNLEYNTSGTWEKIQSAKELIYSRTVAIGLLELIKKQQPDILHAHNIYGRLTTAIFDAARKARIPSVLTLHDYKLICPSYLLIRQEKVCELCLNKGAYQCLVKRCHKESWAASAVYVAEAYLNNIFRKYESVRFFICPSKFLLKKHIEGGVSPEKLVLIPNAIDMSKYTPQFDSDRYILFVGRLSGEKGIKTLLVAMAGLDIPLKVVGDGPLRKEFEQMVRDENIEDVVFEGFRSGKELEKLFQNAAFIVFPSEWYENAPMTILESYGYGKPVIGADIGGISEMIVDGETGILFPPRDSEILREKIDELWNQPKLIRRMGKAARHRLKEKFNVDLHYKRLMNVYSKALI